MRETNILLITRTYPPSVGGMEEYMYQIYNQFQKNNNSYKISLGMSTRLHLFWFVPLALIRALFLINSKSITHLHIGDAFLAPLGIILKRFFRLNISITTYGLDIIFPNRIYQKILKRFIPGYDQIICISQETKNECVKRGVLESKCHVIFCGIDLGMATIIPCEKVSEELVKKSINHDIEGKKVLTTVGRMVPRKGVCWFIENVMPVLSNDFIYIVVGDGKEYVKAKQLVDRLELKGKVYLLGKTTNELRNAIYSIAYAFIMPNIPVPGDMEGFGIVALEAGLFGIPVLASNLEGIKDAVINNMTGKLVIPRDPHSFVNGLAEINELDRETIKNTVRSTFSWENVYSKYSSILKLN